MKGIKKAFLLIFVTLLLSTAVFSSSDYTSKSDQVLPSTSSKSKINVNEKCEDFLLMYVDSEREILKQKQITYDTFLIHIEIFLAGFSIILLIIVGLTGFFGYKFFKDQIKRLEQKLIIQINDKMEENERLTKNSFEEPLNKWIWELNKLKDYMRFLDNYFKKKDEDFPDLIEEREGKEEKPKNIFDET